MFCHPFYSIHSEYLTNEALTGSENFKAGRQVIRTVKYAGDLVLLAKEETLLQGMIDRLIETGRCNGVEMNVKKKVS